MAIYTELYIDQGTTFSKTITLTDDTTNEEINIAGYIISSQMKRSYYAANSLANLVCTITDTANGEITLSLPASNTANIPHGRYVFDVKTTDTSNTVTRILEGTIFIVPQITK